MRDSVFKLLSSFRLVQELSESPNPHGSDQDVEEASLVSPNDPHPSSHDAANLVPAQRTFTVPVPTQSLPSTPRSHPTTIHTKPIRGIRPSIRTHSRKGSKYAMRYSRSRQSSFSNHHSLFPYGLDEISEKSKQKSRKLLCLWPLPNITRYLIVFSLTISILNSIGLLNVKCSAPIYVLFRFEVLNLLLSPLLFSFTPQGVLLFGWNVLILGLFEESLTHLLRGTHRFVKVFGSIVVSVSIIRQGLGYLFSKSTGFAAPSLFFSDSVHECNEGIAPFLFALLVVQALGIDDKYILFYDDESSNRKLTVRKVTLQFLMLLVNYFAKNILWWSLAGLLTGCLAAMIIQVILTQENRQDADEVKDEYDFMALDNVRGLPLWRRLWAALNKIALMIIVTIPVLLVFNAYHAYEPPVDPAVFNQVSGDPYMFTMIVMTAPRRGDPPFLTRTLDSYLSNWPLAPTPGSLYSRIQTIVYTHFTHHIEFDKAKEKLQDNPKSRYYIKWIREEGSQLDQRLHVAKALTLATENYKSTYIALMEDDFPMCGHKEWRELENVVYKANQLVPNHCGVFVGTGGSGLFLKPHIAKLISNLLLIYNDLPPDLIVQKCLRGDLPECQQCSQSLVTSKRLLMHHIGFNTSTSSERSYKNNEFQCGWRHPFNSDPDVITL